MKKQNKGITLISLVITIVLLLILAGITIMSLGGQNSLINRTKKAKKEHEIAQAQELLSIELSNILVDNNGNKDLNKLENLKVNGYTTSVSNIARLVTMTKNNETYYFLVDSNYKIQNLNEISGLNQDSESENNNSNSSLINDFEIKIEEQNGKNIKINIDGTITTKDNSNILGYLILINGQGKNIEKEMPCQITLDEYDTTYKIEVMAIDKEGKTKKSKSSLSVKTPYMIVDVLDYPRMTSNGMMNVKYTNPDNSNDFYYGLDLSKDCTAIDALDKAAYDGDDSTFYDSTSTKCKFYFSDDIDIYQVCFKIDKTYNGTVFWAMDWNQSIATNEGKLLENGAFHTTYYGKNTTSWQNHLAKCMTNVYEIYYDGTIK